MNTQGVGPSSAYVDIVVQNNASMTDAFQFDPPDGDGDSDDMALWNLVGQSFQLDIKGNRQQVAVLLSLSSGAGQIIVDDTALRILHFNVPDTVIAAALVPGEYVYDFIMFDASTPSIRVPLMHGRFVVKEGITA